jgi:hypothetical protein
MKVLGFWLLTVGFFGSPAFAQTAPLSHVDVSLATPVGHEVNVSVGGYDYTEPGDPSISIHGPKFGGGYLGTWSLSRNRHLFLQTDAHGKVGNVTYDGWCAPFLITPESASPNGYALDLGPYSPCSESGDRDWYLEGRGLVGKDFIGHRWAWSPAAGLGVRHLSNGTTGTPGFRTQQYLYLPIGLTARTQLGVRRTLSLNLEYDVLLRGWNTTRNSLLGGGDVPATSTAPAFTLEGLDDVSFTQTKGWGVRAGARFQLTRRWSVEPVYVHWHVSDSSVEPVIATFTVNNVTVQQQFVAVEPVNATNEFVVKFGFRF